MKTPLTAILSLAFRSLRKRPLRAFLIWLTTAVGIAAVISVVSVVRGGTTAFKHDMSNLGIQIITFASAGRPGSPSTLNPEIHERVRSEFGGGDTQFSFAQIDPKKVKVAPDGESKSCTIVEIDKNFLDIFGLRLLTGEDFQYDAAADPDAPGCLIDQDRARELFGNEPPVGRQIEIKYSFKTIAFTVIGVVEDPMQMRQYINKYDTGSLSRMPTAQHLTFKNIYVMRGGYKKPFSASDILGETTLMFVKPREMDDIDRLNARISAFLNENGVRFQGFTMNHWLDSLNATTARIEENSHLIWVIVLMVSAVLIILMNYMAVREQFREIAIRRVEGASRPAIIAQMAAESLLISLLAGVGGVVIGVGITHALCAWVVGWPPYFTVPEIVLAMALAVLVGMIATILPALRAAQVDPAATLRYE
jgi:ABC-type antimicrobial peptide transport system permease subunit